MAVWVLSSSSVFLLTVSGGSILLVIRAMGLTVLRDTST